MNKKQKEYILNNYNKYGIKDITSRNEMLELLNILEAHNVTLDDLHDVTPNDMFCDIFFNYDGTDDNYVYNALLEHNVFYGSRSELVEALRDAYNEYDESKTMSDDDFLQFIKDECYDDEITKTSDGYVRTLYY